VFLVYLEKSLRQATSFIFDNAVGDNADGGVKPTRDATVGQSDTSQNY
jgi:hypothetical protein